MYENFLEKKNFFGHDLSRSNCKRAIVRDTEQTLPGRSQGHKNGNLTKISGLEVVVLATPRERASCHEVPVMASQ